MSLRAISALVFAAREDAVENFSAEGKDAALRYGFGSHGMVVSDNRGPVGPRVDFVEKDHRVYAEHVTAALQRLLPL